MRRIQVLAAAFTVVMMSFGGCLDDSENGETNRAPEALILMPRQASVMEAGKPFQIDGSASIDPDGDDLQYMWTLSGLGSPIDLSTKMSDLVVIDTPGNDLVLTLMVRDPSGLTGQDIVVISVEPGNRSPTATITTPSNGGAYSEGKEVTFNGMASSDPDNDILSYNWDLGEAGGPTYTASKQSKFKMELDEGDYSVTLTVEDPDPPTTPLPLPWGVFRSSKAKTPATISFEATFLLKRNGFKSQPLCANNGDLSQNSITFRCREYQCDNRLGCPVICSPKNGSVGSR